MSTVKIIKKIFIFNLIVYFISAGLIILITKLYNLEYQVKANLMLIILFADLVTVQYYLYRLKNKEYM